MKRTCLKSLLVILLLFMLQTSKAQQSIPEIEVNGRTYSQIFDSLSTGLIPSRIPYGVLMDRVYGLGSLKHFTITNNNHK